MALSPESLRRVMSNPDTQAGMAEYARSRRTADSTQRPGTVRVSPQTLRQIQRMGMENALELVRSGNASPEFREAVHRMYLGAGNEANLEGNAARTQERDDFVRQQNANRPAQPALPDFATRPAIDTRPPPLEAGTPRGASSPGLPYTDVAGNVAIDGGVVLPPAESIIGTDRMGNRTIGGAVDTTGETLPGVSVTGDLGPNPSMDQIVRALGMSPQGGGSGGGIGTPGLGGVMQGADRVAGAGNSLLSLLGGTGPNLGAGRQLTPGLGSGDQKNSLVELLMSLLGR